MRTDRAQGRTRSLRPVAGLYGQRLWPTSGGDALWPWLLTVEHAGRRDARGCQAELPSPDAAAAPSMSYEVRAQTNVTRGYHRMWARAQPWIRPAGSNLLEMSRSARRPSSGGAHRDQRGGPSSA